MEELGVAGFPPETPAGLEAESCGKTREDVSPGHDFDFHTTTSCGGRYEKETISV